MVPKCLRSYLLPLAILAACASSFAADFDAGLKAYNAGDFPAALKEWEPLAEKGAPHAQYNLGLMYARGQGVPQDFSKAADFYKKAADQGIVEAEYNLGVLYGNGQGVKKDEAEASKWFLKAAEKGDVNAANSLGNIYDEGPGGFQNFSEAEKWYRKAADSGVAIAQFNLGVMYDIGQGVKQDFGEALRWYQKAAEQGNPAALCNIAVLYYNGEGVKMDRVQSHRYFMIAKDLGEPRAANLIKLTTEKLTKKQLTQAATMAEEWRNRHPQKTMEALAAPPQSDDKFEAVNTKAAAGSQADRIVTGYAAPAPTSPMPVANQSSWEGVARIVAVGDVHGDYDQLFETLKASGIVDASGNWIAGKTHLVQTGDILDRGGRSRDVMDLLMKLQRQASAAGGYVHCLLGNHEVMNLYGDLRYVSPGEYGAFRSRESRSLRDKEFENFRAAAGDKTMTKEDWDKQHPLGYFEHRAAFGMEGVYGKWLRSLNSAIRINDTLFVHAGLSARYAEMPLDEMNKKVREELNNPAMLQGGIVTDTEGPFWYRGLAKASDQDPMPALDKTLSTNGVKREAIGHTYADAAITPRFGGRVILLDIGLPRVYDNSGKIGALLIENDKPYALHRGHKLELPKDNGPDMLRYLKEAAAFDPAPSPLAARIEKLSR